MKKILMALVIMCFIFTAVAQEQVLFDSSVVADFEGYDYVSNFEMTSKSGYFPQSSLKVLSPNENGMRFMATGVPSNVSSSYSILTAYPSFLNEAGTGAGVIYNAGAIKQIKVTMSTNRPYDEIILLYSTSPNGVIHEIKMPQDFNAVHSMEEFTLTFDNPLYISDVTKRPISSPPVLGADQDGIYLRGFRVKTNAPSQYSRYSEYSVIYLKKVTVVCDRVFTDEQLEIQEELKTEFDIDENRALTDKTKAEITERNRIREQTVELMASDE